MRLLQYILLIATVNVALEMEQARAFAWAKESEKKSINAASTKMGNVSGVHLDPESVRILNPPTRSAESRRVKPGFGYITNAANRKANLSRLLTVPSVETRVSNKQALVSTGPLTAILPGLPSPLVAMVDPAEAATVAANLPREQERVYPTAAGQVPADSHPATAFAAGVGLSSPISITASVLPIDERSSARLLLPFDQNVGAAAFRRGNTLLVVVDSSKPVDLASIAGDPVFGTASYSLLSSGAVLTLSLGQDVHVEVLRKQEGWLVEVMKPGQETKVIQREAGAEDITFPVADPGHVVVVNDPVRKTDLLVGTVKQDHQNMPLGRREPDFSLDETLLGLVVERFADRLDMRATSGSFVINGSVAEGLSPTGYPSVDIKMPFSRSLDLPPVDDAELERRYKTALATTAAAAVADRRLTRLNAAEAAMALGEAREAGELVGIADQDAPAGPQPGRAIFLRAVAAVLNREPEAYNLLEDPRMPHSDEVVMWRAIDLAHRESGNPDAARTISRYLPLIESYPAHLRDQLLGRAAISLAMAGGPLAVTQVQSLRGDGTVRLAQALILENDGENAKALGALGALASDVDPAVVFVASEKAIALRLKLGQIKPKQAADCLDAQTLNARMADKELFLKLQIVSLRVQDADWAAALSTLRETLTSFPGASSQIARAFTDILERMMSTKPPLNIAQLSLVQSNINMMHAGVEQTKVLTELARRFVELDLPDHAASLVGDAITHTSPGAERASLGVELARLRLDQADVAGAITALQATAAADLPAELSNARAFVQARAEAAAGQTDAALAALRPLHGPEVDDLRASELALKHDWQGEAAALASLVAQKIPATGPLAGQKEDLVLRLVAATARAGDRAALRQIEVSLGVRFQTPAKLDMLRLLTSDSVRTEGDLARSATELSASQRALSALAAAPTKNGS